VDPTTGSVILRVVFPNPQGVLLPGMFVRAVVREGINEQAILIPQQAVSRDPKGNPVALIVDAGGRSSSGCSFSIAPSATNGSFHPGSHPAIG